MHPKAQTILTVVLVMFFLTSLSACQNAVPPTPTKEISEPLLTETASPTLLPATDTPVPTASPTVTATATPIPPSATPTPVSYGPTNFPVNINPLTGLEISSPELLDRRPIAVKINLVPRTTYRPTWGLSLADIVWEFYHNDGYPRLHAIFYGQDAELAGAIRSARLPDHDLIQMYKSIFAYGSADTRVNFRLLNASYSNRLVLEGQRSNCPPTSERPLCRIEPQGPDLLLSGTKELSQHITNLGVENGRQNLDGMTFHDTPPANGNPATEAIVHYSIDSYDQWEYDPLRGRYLLSMDGGLASTPAEEIYSPLLDRVTDLQISAENVVILVAQHQYYQPPPNEIIEILLSGTGKALALRDGMAYEVIWNRPTLDSVLYLTYPNGEAYPFKPGNTWFHLIGTSSLIQQLGEGSWRFDFRFP
jgi:hypothetical protein